MPDMSQTESASVPSAALVASMPAEADFDYALGCECADPSLQIERWGIDEPEAGEAN